MPSPPILKKEGMTHEMKIEYLVYCGKREEGILTVARVDVLSPHRKLKYYKGLRLELGKHIPIDVGKIIAKDYPSVFTLETKEFKAEEVYEFKLCDALEECQAVMGDEVALKVISQIVSKYFDGHQVVDVRGKKEATLVEKAKTKRVRRTK